jgi:PKD repeat protein
LLELLNVKTAKDVESGRTSQVLEIEVRSFVPRLLSGRCYLIRTIVYLFVLGAGIEAFGFSPPLQNVTVTLEHPNSTTWNVVYSVYDPERGQIVTGGSAVFNAYAVTLTNNNGVVAWLKKFDNSANSPWNMECSVYDPGIGQWRSGGSANFSAYDVTMASGEGVVALLKKFDNSANSPWNMECSVYDAARGQWRSGGSANFTAGNVLLSIANATITYTVDGLPNLLGYDYISGLWYGGQTKSFSYFIASKTSGIPPLTVWFTDMSIGAASWSWNLGDGAGTSSQRSHYYTFNSLGRYTVTENISGLSGNHSASRIITTDIYAPSGSVIINGGEVTTFSTAVTLTLSATDNSGFVAFMRFSNDDSIWSTWEPFSTSRAWTLISGDGVKTLYVQFKDAAENVSSVVSDTITLDTSPPISTLQLSASTYFVTENVGSVTIPVTRTGASNGAVGVSYATANGSATAGQDYTSSSGTLNFTIGQTLQNVTVSILDDATFENNETFTITLLNPTGGAILGSPTIATVTVVDDESALGPIQFTAGSVGGNAGSQVLVPMRVIGFTNILTFQYSVHWDPAIITFVGIEQFNLNGLGVGNFGTSQTNAGALTVSWDDPNVAGANLANGSALFAIRFDIVGQGGQVSVIGIDGAPTPVEVVRLNGGQQEIVSPILTAGGVIVIPTVALTGGVTLHSSGLAVPGVNVVLTGDSAQNTTTPANGIYGFTVNAGGNYTVTPLVTNATPGSQGVTTLDIFQVRKHIVDPVNSPLNTGYKVLAADVNGSQSVTTLDILEMRKLILGNSAQLPAGAWRFVRSDYIFANSTAPWDALTNRIYTGLVGDQNGQGFTAVKLGDVDASWSVPSGGTASAPSQNRGVPATVSSLGFRVVDANGLPGSTVKVTLAVSGFSQVTTFQFSLSWDTNLLRCTSIGDFGIAGLAAGSFGVSQTNAGLLSVSWDDLTANGITLPDGTPLFTLQFSPLVAGTATIAFSDTPTLREVTVNGGATTFNGVTGTVTVSTGIQPAGLPDAAFLLTRGFPLIVAAPAGKECFVEASSNLTNWTVLTNFVGNGYLLEFLDAAASNANRRYYRLKWTD